MSDAHFKMLRFAKTKTILLALAVLPTALILACGGEEVAPAETLPLSTSDIQSELATPPLYTPISAETCKKFQPTNLSPPFDNRTFRIVCFKVPESGEYMLTEEDNPLYVRAEWVKTCRFAGCFSFYDRWLNYLAKYPTLTVEEVLRREGLLEDG